MQVLPVLAFVGKSGQGKTTLLELVVKELTERGHKVGVIKDAHHTCEVDKNGKDTFRLKKAGSSEVVLNSPGLVAYISTPKKEPTLKELLSHFSESDFVLIEGFKYVEDLPKVEVFRKDSGIERLGNLKNLVFRVSDTQFSDGVKSYLPDDISGVATAVEKFFGKKI